MSCSIATLETPRLWLRGITLADAPDYQRYFAEYEVVRHLASAVPWPYPADGVEAYLRDVILPVQGQDRWLWGLVEKTRPAHCIGGIELFRQGRPEQRGFWLGRPFWGRGLMSEAADAVTDHAFEELGFDKLVLSNALGNERSRRIKEKAGARLVSVEPAAFVDPEYTQHELWELRKEDWLARR